MQEDDFSNDVVIKKEEKNNDLPSVIISKEMQASYLDYAMSVIVSRALPDVTDGLKPVHRRILFSMHETGTVHNKPHKKSARVVGDVIGNYHPHGDTAIYDAMVRMAQPFSMRHELVDGQGNFGSIDGDSPAAMRYTESRLTGLASELLMDLEYDTVMMIDNYDGSKQEPVVLPAKFPNILVNGAGGIAVGMATNIPPHNLREVVSATIAKIDNPAISDEELLQLMPGPDFPTGGSIVGRAGSIESFKTGRGRVIMRGEALVEKKDNKSRIVIKEIPYQVNKASLVEKIADLVKEKKIEGITDLRDESNKNGIKVVIDLRRDVNPELILNQLYHHTPLQTSFSSNMVALHGGVPMLMNTQEILHAFIEFRVKLVRRRIEFLLGKAQDRAHLLIGLAIAVDSIDKIVAIIRASRDRDEARRALAQERWPGRGVENLIFMIGDYRNKVSEDGTCKLTAVQIEAILDMRLARLTGLEKDKIEEESKELCAKIKEYLDILAVPQAIKDIVKEELQKISDQYGQPRRTRFIESLDFNAEDLIPDEDVVISITASGYIKRQPLEDYRTQKRGGKGKFGSRPKEEDYLVDVFMASSLSPVLFFTNLGKVYKLKAYQIPSTNSGSGRAIVNLLPLAQGEKIARILILPQDEAELEGVSFFFVTAMGLVKRNSADSFKRIQANGKLAMVLGEGDSLVGVDLCRDGDHVMLSSNAGKVIRFVISEDSVRTKKGRASGGNKGMRLKKAEVVVSVVVLPKGKDCFAGNSQGPLLEATGAIVENSSMYILSITENGYAKRTKTEDYRLTSRGGMGILDIKTDKRNGAVVQSLIVTDDTQIIAITNRGKFIRCTTKGISALGRNTGGVRLIRLEDGAEDGKIIRPDSEKVVSAVVVAQGYGDEDDPQLVNIIDE